MGSPPVSVVCSVFVPLTPAVVDTKTSLATVVTGAAELVVFKATPVVRGRGRVMQRLVALDKPHRNVASHTSGG
jgi:hypothetical protein